MDDEWSSKEAFQARAFGVRSVNGSVICSLVLYTRESITVYNRLVIAIRLIGCRALPWLDGKRGTEEVVLSATGSSMIKIHDIVMIFEIIN